MDSIQSLIVNFAVTYNCGAYGASTYNNDEACTDTTATNTGTTTTEGGTLLDTGQPYIIPLVAGILLIVMALALIAMKARKKRHS